MNNKKGFTLVEMIAVLVILTILFIISFPTVLGVLKRTEKKISESQLELFKSASKDYINDRPAEYKQLEGDKYCVGVQSLIDGNYISEKQIEDIDSNFQVNITMLEKKDLSIEVGELCYVKSMDVTFELKGDSEIKIQVGSTWTDPGFIAMDNDYLDISSSVTVQIFNESMTKVDTLDTSQAGIYVIEYKINHNDKENVIERIVDVTLGTNPVITHPGDTLLPTTVKNFNILEGVSAKDSSGKELKVEAQTNLSLGVKGIYYVKYTAKDTKGNISSVSRNIESFIPYTETILNGTDPVLDEGMIPITISNDGTVKKANLEDRWFSYENKKWANAVLVNSSTRDKYKKANFDTIIEQTDILAYLVWIPRYKYKIPTNGTATPSTIDIVFEDKNTTKTKGDAKNTYYSHPAFNFGTTEVNGIWVGKFETTGNATTPTILPNLSSIRNQNQKIQFNTSLKFKNNIYGLVSDSHLIKASEWGAVAYISHSKYGLNNKIRINNNVDSKTGCGASTDNATQSTTCDIEYGSNVANYPQSSTGNITGIFDLAGGSWERIMGNHNKINAGSGFASGLTDINEKYYDIFNTTDISTACNGICYGYALSETAGWYGSLTTFPNEFSSWLGRGGGYLSIDSAVIYSLEPTSGIGNKYYSFRVSVTPGT